MDITMSSSKTRRRRRDLQFNRIPWEAVDTHYIGTRYHTEDLYSLLQIPRDHKKSGSLAEMIRYRLGHRQKMKEDMFDMMTNPPIVSSILSGPQEGENPMGHYATANILVNQPTQDFDKVQHLLNRLEEVQYRKLDKLRTKFYTVDEPKTAKEAIERVKAGKFTLDEKAVKRAEENEDYGYGSWYGFSWRTEPLDQDAFDKAETEIYNDYVYARDTIKIVEPAEGLKAFREFADKAHGI